MELGYTVVLCFCLLLIYFEDAIDAWIRTVQTVDFLLPTGLEGDETADVFSSSSDTLFW
jgi:hypothetical protein